MHLLGQEGPLLPEDPESLVLPLAQEFPEVLLVPLHLAHQLHFRLVLEYLEGQ